MGKITRNLKSFAGMTLTTTVVLIVVFFVWNYLASKNLGPVSGIASWVSSHANGSAYSTATAPSQAAASYQGPGF
jgi:hypothetical protein